MCCSFKGVKVFERDQYRERRRQIATWYNNNLPFKCIPGKNYIWERYSLNVPFDEVDKVLDKPLYKMSCKNDV